MKKQVIIYGDIQKKSIQFLYSQLRKFYGSSKRTATVHPIPQNDDEVRLKRVNTSERVEACFIYHLDIRFFNPGFFHSITTRSTNPFNNNTKDFQFFVATTQKPYFCPSQLRKINLYELPAFHDKNYLTKLAKLIWVQIQLNALPSSNLEFKDALHVKEYYENRLSAYRKRLNQAEQNHLKNIEVKDAKVVA